MVKKDSSIKSVLVTGGGGFIGGHVVDILLERGFKVGVFDRNKNKNLPEKVTMHLGDIRDYETITEAISLYDGVIHVAGVLGTQETVNNPLPAVQTNVIGGLNVFQGCRSHKKKGVYIGVGNYWMINPYSVSKTTAEKFALMFNQEHGTKIAVVRGLNAYGPRQKHKPVRKIIPNFVLPAIRNKEITIYGSGNQRMDMIYVKDLAEVLVRALIVEHNTHDEVFSAGTGLAPTVNEIAKTVIEVSQSKAELKHVNMRPGETKESVVIGDPKTLIPLFDKVPDLLSLEEGIKKTVAYYKANIKNYPD